MKQSAFAIVSSHFASSGMLSDMDTPHVNHMCCLVANPTLKIISATGRLLASVGSAKGAERRAHAVCVDFALLNPSYEEPKTSPAPVHIQRLAGHEGGVVAGEKRQCADQIVRHLGSVLI